MGGGVQGIKATARGIDLGLQEATSGNTYQEFEISSVKTTTVLYEYSCCPSDPFPAIQYSFKLKRQGLYYLWILIFPGILVTFLSFAVFFSDTASSDPLGYGMAIIIVNLLMGAFLTDAVPVCGEMLWSDVRVPLNRFHAIPMPPRRDTDHAQAGATAQFLRKRVARVCASALRGGEHDLLLHLADSVSNLRALREL